jgi:hypothetical protein
MHSSANSYPTFAERRGQLVIITGQIVRSQRSSVANPCWLESSQSTRSPCRSPATRTRDDADNTSQNVDLLTSAHCRPAHHRITALVATEILERVG